MTECAYRCALCGHGKRLTAWALVLMHGPLGADGHLAENGYGEEIEVQEDSISCTKHPDAVIERMLDGAWCRWWSCPECDGRGWISGGSPYPDYPCPAEPRTSAWQPVAHKGWLPVAEALARAGGTS
jgi:hypothetical protein